MAELALSMSSVSLTFQVFSGCIQAYQILCDAKHFPSDCQYLRVRLKTEQYRLLDWAEVVQLDTTDDKLLISNSSKGLLLDILDQKRRLLFQFGRYDDKYRELGKPLLVAEDGSDITDTQPTNSTASKKENPPRMIRKNSDFQVQFPGSTTLLQKSLEYARKTKSSQIRSVRWVTFDKKKFEKLIWKLATFNDFMREMLSTIQLDNLATKQTRTELQINQLNESIQNLLKIYESSGAGSSKTERLKLTLHSPLREYLRANGLTDLEGDGTDSGTSSSLNSPNTFEQVKALQQSLLNRTTISQPEYFIPLESAPTATSATEDAAQKRADGINAEPSARQQDDMPRSLSPFPGRLFIQDTRSSVGSDIDPRQSSFSTGISEAATLVSSFKSLVHALNTTVEQEAAKLYYESPEIEILDVGPAADEPPILISSSHMLPEKADIISQQTWKDLVQLLPESLRLGLQYNELDGSSCWTYTPNPAFTPTSIPLTIAGIPVVIPLKYRYPIRAPSGAPPDPYPFKIDPTAMASSTIVDAIFNTFSDILGFYILINGFLQLLIPEDYDLEDALQRYPTRFGDLKISYVPFCVLSTGSASEAPIAEASSSTSNAPDHLRVSRGLGIVERTAAWAALSTSRIMANRTISSSASIHQLDFSSTLRARVLKQRSPSWFGGKPGVLTRKGSKQFLTFSTHVATKALEEAKHKFSSDESWTERVEVYHGNLKVCWDGTVLSVC
ncbi:hypothetical protein DM02DRAFT_229105 [Periconia macrospinosa]|uniref:Prion-inhibition and propagation HeLo domain-containing protein n=1 Tax=Periconia macrospinosa TaxID=97972 RepID=A0A2V1D5S8_9PLEO|nr:hypothetical protein DM02DRAFT_229105 [Periconia macrospinosa]